MPAPNISRLCAQPSEPTTACSRCSPLPHDNEVTLLAVDRDVHGLGVGTVLLDAAVSHLSSLGATRAHLYTDSNCSWKFYELHGFKRTATHRANREERRHDMPRESFLYELDLTA